MNRTVFAIALLAAATAAFAQLRTIPVDAKRGTMRHVQALVVEVDGRQAKLAPGAQIRGTNNFVILPAALPPGSLVKYQVDGDGMIKQVWVLTPEEAAQRDARR